MGHEQLEGKLINSILTKPKLGMPGKRKRVSSKRATTLKILPKNRKRDGVRRSQKSSSQKERFSVEGDRQRKGNRDGPAGQKSLLKGIEARVVGVGGGKDWSRLGGSNGASQQPMQTPKVVKKGRLGEQY